MARASQLTTERYDHVMKMLNPNINREPQQENTADMASNAYSFPVDIAQAHWIIDTGAINLMVADLRLLNNVKAVNTKGGKKVNLPNAQSSTVTHIGNCRITGLLQWGGEGDWWRKDGLYLLVSQTNKAARAEPREVTRGLIAQGNKEEVMVWYKRLAHALEGATEKTTRLQLRSMPIFNR